MSGKMPKPTIKPIPYDDLHPHAHPVRYALHMWMSHLADWSELTRAINGNPGLLSYQLRSSLVPRESLLALVDHWHRQRIPGSSALSLQRSQDSQRAVHVAGAARSAAGLALSSELLWTAGAALGPAVRAQQEAVANDAMTAVGIAVTDYGLADAVPPWAAMKELQELQARCERLIGAMYGTLFDQYGARGWPAVPNDVRLECVKPVADKPVSSEEIQASEGSFSPSLRDEAELQ